MEIRLKISVITIGINLKDSTESLCDRCYFSMCVMSRESFMVSLNCSYTCNMEVDVTPGKRAEINNRKPAYLYNKRNRCIHQLEVLLCRRNTNIIR